MVDVFHGKRKTQTHEIDVLAVQRQKSVSEESERVSRLEYYNHRKS